MRQLNFLWECVAALPILAENNRVAQNAAIEEAGSAIREVVSDAQVIETGERLKEVYGLFGALKGAMYPKTKGTPLSGEPSLTDREAQGRCREVVAELEKALMTMTAGHVSWTAKKIVADYGKWESHLFPSGVEGIAVPKTNNRLEQVFRRMRRNVRKRCGDKATGRQLTLTGEMMLLYQNLANPAYVEAVFGEESVATVFGRKRASLPKVRKMGRKERERLLDQGQQMLRKGQALRTPYTEEMFAEVQRPGGGLARTLPCSETTNLKPVGRHRLERQSYYLTHHLNYAKMPEAGVSIVIPAYNEEVRIRSTLEQYLPALERLNTPFEILVVCDGMEDKTADVAREYFHRNVKVLQFGVKLGKGGAVFAGFRRAQYDYVGFVDADGPITPSDLTRLLTILDSSDCVIASRWMKGSVVSHQEPPLKRLFSKVWIFLARAMLLLPLQDMQCGAKLMRRDVMDMALREVALTNWAFDVSLLYHINQNDYRITEVPVTWSHDPRSRMRLGKDIPVMLFSLIGVRLVNLPIFSKIFPKLAEAFDRIGVVE